MERKSRIVVSIVVASVFMLAAIGSASAATYESLAGMKSIKAIFDVRAGNTKSAVMQLKLIHDTYKDKSIRAVSKKPSFIVAFMGPSVKLISKDKQGISPEDQKSMDEIALTVRPWPRTGSSSRFATLPSRRSAWIRHRSCRRSSTCRTAGLP